MATKVKSEKKVEFAKGGTTPMFGKSQAAPQVPGQTASQHPGGVGAKIASGGKGHMFGRQYAGPQKPGTTAHDTSGSGGKFMSGGGKRDVPPQHANTVVPGRTGK